MATLPLMNEDTEMVHRYVNHTSMLFYAAALLVAYALTLFVPVGWGTYIVGLPAYLIILMTCIARANNLDKQGRIHDARRFGFAIMTGTILMIILEPVFGGFPKWPRVYGAWGLAIIWMTTEGLVPWWELVTGAWDGETLSAKLRLFLRSLRGNLSWKKRQKGDVP